MCPQPESASAGTPYRRSPTGRLARAARRVALIGRLRSGAADIRSAEVVALDTPDSLTAAVARHVDVLVLTSSRPARDLRRLLLTTGHETPILVLSADSSPASVRAAFAMGATGFLVEGEYTAAELDAAVQRSAVGDHAVTSSVTRALLSEPASAGGSDGRSADVHLTERERQVLRLLVTGASDRRIAAVLHLAERTVRNYASRLYAKLAVGGRTEAAVWALTHDVDPFGHGDGAHGL